MEREHTYSPRVTSEVCQQVIRDEGAILIKNFVSEHDQNVITRAVLSETLTPVDRSNHTIPEQFDDVGWKFRQAPPAVVRLGKDICSLVRPAVPSWFINEVRAQRYKPGEVGIEWHRDYKRDLRIVAVASFLGSAAFDIRLDSGEVSWQLNPGDLVLMRGALLNGRIDDRPQHRVSPPEIGQRLSIAYRQVAAEVPELEPLSCVG